MEPILILLFMLLLVPVIAGTIAIVPVYIGLWVALYWVYGARGDDPNPALDVMFDWSVVWEQYEKLFAHWEQYGDQMDFVSFTLPLFLPPLVGILVAVYFVIRFLRYLRDIFRMV